MDSESLIVLYMREQVGTQTIPLRNEQISIKGLNH